MPTTNPTINALHQTIIKMVPAVLIAMISTALGLLSLYRSSVPMIQDFGSMLTIGIIIACAIAVFIFLPFLYIKDKHFPKELSTTKRQINTNRVVPIIMNVVIKLRYLIILLAILLAAFGIYVDQDAKAETDLENFMPQNSQALEDIKTLRALIGSTEQIAIVFETDSILNAANLSVIEDTQAHLNEHFSQQMIEMSSIISLFHQIDVSDVSLMTESALLSIPVDQQKLFINETRTKSIINISIVPMSDKSFEAFVDELNAYFNTIESDLDIKITGQSIIDVEMMKSLTSGRYEITIIGLVLIFFSLLVIYRSFYRAILPLIPIVMIVGWSGGIMAIFGISYTPLTATLGALIMGIGTEFTILITERFEEEKLKFEDRHEAIKITLSKMSNPILVSALTTMGGFSALIFSDFVILSNFGIMTLINLSLALLSTIIVLPAILSLSFRNKTEVRSPVYST